MPLAGETRFVRSSQVRCSNSALLNDGIVIATRKRRSRHTSAEAAWENRSTLKNRSFQTKSTSNNLNVLLAGETRFVRSSQVRCTNSAQLNDGIVIATRKRRSRHTSAEAAWENRSTLKNRSFQTKSTSNNLNVLLAGETRFVRSSQVRCTNSALLNDGIVIATH